MDLYSYLTCSIISYIMYMSVQMCIYEFWGETAESVRTCLKGATQRGSPPNDQDLPSWTSHVRSR